MLITDIHELVHVSVHLLYICAPLDNGVAMISNTGAQNNIQC